MLSVTVIWLYMLFTCYVTGFACIRLISGKQNFRCRKETDYIYAGIGVATVYAQFFSIFHKVGIAANLVLVAVCILCIGCFRKELTEKLHTCRLTLTPAKAIAVIAIFLFFAYGTSTGLIHYDSGLYHAQSIRWIEEYGIVPGLGNLHSRLAYNSSSFCLSALYSMAFLGGQSYHCCAGFLALLLALVCLEGLDRKRIRRPMLSDFVRIIAVYYLMNIFDEMISPASDYFMVLLVFLIVIRWTELLEAREKSFFPYALLCVLCVLVFTVKLSGALILLLTLKPAVMMIRENKGREILKFLLLGLLTAAPFLIRNVILSGWLIYPFTAIDLFSFPFKIPKGMADYDAREIQVYGRGFTEVERYGEPVGKWLPEWIRSQDGSDKVFLLMAVSGVILLLIYAVYGLIKRRKDMVQLLHLEGTLAVCFLFWLLSAPLIRYGCVFLWLFPTLVWGHLYLAVSPCLDRYKIYQAAIIFLGAYKLIAFGSEVGRGATGEYLLNQKDYEEFETKAYQLHGYTFYYPVEGDRTGYASFPGAPVKAEDIFAGETIEEGFRDVIHEQ